MATLGTDLWTMADWIAEQYPNGDVPAPIKMLGQRNDIYEDIIWREGNLDTGHMDVVEAGLPDPTWFGLNEGIVPTKGANDTTTFEMGSVGSISQISAELANLGGKAAMRRANAAGKHIEAIKQGFVGALMYGDPVANPTTDLKKFPGFHFYYKDATNAASKENIIKHSSTPSGADNTSIYLAAWGEGLHCFTPKGLPIGLKHEDDGIQQRQDSTTQAVLKVYQDSFRQHGGLCLSDWRFAARICNIDISRMVANTASEMDAIIDSMIKAYYKIPTFAERKPAYYCNRTIATALHIAAKNSVKNSTLSIETFEGKPVTHFLGIPIRIVDQLSNAEGTIS